MFEVKKLPTNVQTKHEAHVQPNHAEERYRLQRKTRGEDKRTLRSLK